MDGIHPLLPDITYALINRHSPVDYQKLNIQTHERADLSFMDREASGSREVATIFSRQRSLFYERSTIQQNANQVQLGNDLLDVRASQRYGSYLLVEKITFRIEEQFGFSAQHTDALSKLDTSVQGAATSIFEMSITVYSQYKAQALRDDNSVNEDTLLADFTNRLHQAVDRGFQEAIGVLEKMNEFNEDIRSSVTASYNMLNTLLEAFKESQHERATTANKASESVETPVETAEANRPADQPDSADEPQATDEQADS